MSISEMRLSYDALTLDEKDMNPDPWVQFQKWWDEITAAQTPDWFEPNAMTLSTADDAGNVTSRIVLLKGFAPPSFTFYTNYRSVKGRAIAANPKVSLCFSWAPLQRQVRIVGTAAIGAREKSKEYFESRPRESQIGAIASDQSIAIESRQALQQRWESLQAQYEDQTPPCPDHWGAYEVTPTHIEFWQGRPGRLH
ncbi:MAG: pyridoxamine 5'-phosphate oxidase, partial [Planctomycetota bacterium]